MRKQRRANKRVNIILTGIFVCLFVLGGISSSDAGWTLIDYDNQSNVAWGDFHIEIEAIEGQSGSLFDISNVVFDIDDPFQPTSSQTLDSVTLTDAGKKLNFFFYGDTVASGDNDAWWLAHISNPDGVLHKVSFYPSVVPEPVSSTLFIIGAATLGFRRFRKKKELS